MKLTDLSIRTFKPVKYFKENLDKINSLSYSSNGETLISSSDDDQMMIYDCSSGTVLSLCMSPIDDTFLSGALDSTVRLWDLRSQNCHGVMHVSGRPTAAFDPEGLIFAAGINSESVKLYDLRSFDKGPFATFRPDTSEVGMVGGDIVAEMPGTEWTGLKFSPDGKTLLITTNGAYIRLMDAFKGTLLHTLSVLTNIERRRPLDACFTPDSQFVLAGQPDGHVAVWNVESGVRVASLPGHELQLAAAAAAAGSAVTAVANAQHNLQLHCVQFNPRFAMLATGASQTSFWLPTVEE